MSETVEGIVLKTSDYQEKSKILQVFTKEHGLIGIFLKGANDYKQANFVVSQPLTHASFVILYKEGLSSSFRGEIIESFRELKVDFNRNVYLFHIFELIIKTFEQHIPYPGYYDLLVQLMHYATNETDFIRFKLAITFYEWQLFDLMGITPQVTNCVECGSSQDITNFDIPRGGFVCANCINSSQKSYSLDTLKTLYQLTLITSWEEIPDVGEEVIHELRHLFLQYDLYHLGFKTNSSKYLT